MIELSAPWILPATVTDVNGVHSVALRCFDTPWERGVFEEELGRDWAYLRVLRESRDGPIVAFVSFWLIRDEVHVLNLATHPTVQRRGHGRRLMAHVLELARAESVRYVSLEVRKDNRPARLLYQEMGFKPIGVRPRYYVEDGSDAVVMLRPL